MNFLKRLFQPRKLSTIRNNCSRVKPRLEALEDRLAPTVELLSPGQPPGTSANGGSFTSNNLVISSAFGRTTSDDGRFVVFLSDATNLVPSQVDTNGKNDVFRLDRQTGQMMLISHTGDGVTAADDQAFEPQISGDGQTIVFLSRASDQVPGFVDNNPSFRADVFLWQNGTVTLISGALGSATQSGDEGSDSALVSADGSVVVFASAATDLVAGFVDNNGGDDIYRWSAGVTTLVSGALGSATQSGDGSSIQPVLSDDGTTIAYASYSEDLVAGFVGGNGFYEIYRWRAGVTTLVSGALGSAAQGGNDDSELPQISENGNVIAFESLATDLVAGFVDGNGTSSDYYRWESGVTTLVTAKAGLPNEGSAGVFQNAALSGDGNVVVFSSAGDDLAAGYVSGSGGDNDIFAWSGGVVSLVSGANGSVTQGSDVQSTAPTLSRDGSVIAFFSFSTDLLPGYTGAGGDIFVRTGGMTLLASGVGGSATQGTSNFDTREPYVSADGNLVVFDSQASDLVAGDTNVTIDVFGFTPPAAANLVVDNVGDENDGDFGAGQLTLREAIALANAMADANTITFDPTVFGTAQIITLTGGQFTLTADVTITGPGANLLTIDAGGASRHFTIDIGVTAEFSGLTLTNGRVVGLSGGSIETSGALSVTDSTISNSVASKGGGGLSVSGSGASATVTGSTFTGNSASVGGGIVNLGTLMVSNSTFNGNLGSLAGGGIANRGTATIDSTTISGNTSNAGGGGIDRLDGTIKITITNSIIAGNTDMNGEPRDVSGSVEASSSFNLIGDAASAGGLVDGVNGNLVGVDPLLGPLADNGGPTMTMALLPGSPAINAGDPAFTPPPDTDQRGTGFDRVKSGRVDIGAFELSAGPPVFTPADPNPAAKHGGTFKAGQAQYADVNGDGKDDLILQGNDNRFWLSLSNGAGFGGSVLVAHHAGSFMKGQAQYADVNGDGKADLIFQSNDNSFLLSLSNGAGFGAPAKVAKHGGTFKFGQAQYADVNGDNKADLIFQGNDNRFWLSRSSGAGFTAPRMVAQHGGTFTPGQAQYADVNGDGKADLIFQGNDNHFWLSRSSGAGFTAPRMVAQHGGTFKFGQAQYADINGDGKADLIFQGNDNRFWLSRSTSTGFTGAALVAQRSGSFKAGQARYARFSSDNKADLTFQTNDNSFWMSLGNDVGFDLARTVLDRDGSFMAGQAQYADINGDGLADLILQDANNEFFLAFADESGGVP